VFPQTKSIIHAGFLSIEIQKKMVLPCNNLSTLNLAHACTCMLDDVLPKENSGRVCLHQLTGCLRVELYVTCHVNKLLDFSHTWI
jgi:hypothetical protein